MRLLGDGMKPRPPGASPPHPAAPRPLHPLAGVALPVLAAEELLRAGQGCCWARGRGLLRHPSPQH